MGDDEFVFTCHGGERFDGGGDVMRLDFGVRRLAALK
jgi:hypothetical protein